MNILFVLPNAEWVVHTLYMPTIFGNLHNIRDWIAEFKYNFHYLDTFIITKMPNIPYYTMYSARKLNLEKEKEKRGKTQSTHLRNSNWSSRSVAPKIVELFSVVVESRKKVCIQFKLRKFSWSQTSINLNWINIFPA